MNRVYERIARTLGSAWSEKKSGRELVGCAVGLMGFCVVWKGASFVWKYYAKPFPTIRAKYSNSWAIVTGATGGIGLGVVHELAAQGVNVVLVARNAENLATTAAVVRAHYPGVKVRIVSLDAENPGDFSALLTVIRDVDVSLLFNNVGVHNHIPTNVADMDPQEVRRLVDVNCTFQVQLTTLVLPQMVQYMQNKASGQGPAVVVNISSLTSKMAMPMLSVYAATKAFEEHYTEGLAAELQPLGIEAMCLRPGLTVSAMSGETKESLFCPTAAVMARACVRMLGCGEVSVVPYGPHALLDGINNLVPKSLTWSIVRDMHAKKRADLLLVNKTT